MPTAAQVKLYAWDDQDPLLKAWSKTFPGTVQPLSAISGDLMSHLRYPEDLFKVQRSLMARYHVTDPGAFYGGQDYWTVPDDPTQEQRHGAAAAVLPQRRDAGPALAVVLPDDDVHAVRVTGRCWPGSWRSTPTPATPTGKKRADYGKMRLLELPTGHHGQGSRAGPERHRVLQHRLARGSP